MNLYVIWVFWACLQPIYLPYLSLEWEGWIRRLTDRRKMIGGLSLLSLKRGSLLINELKRVKDLSFMKTIIIPTHHSTQKWEKKAKSYHLQFYAQALYIFGVLIKFCGPCIKFEYKLHDKNGSFWTVISKNFKNLFHLERKI